jgi:hypothetical protein
MADSAPGLGLPTRPAPLAAGPPVAWHQPQVAMAPTLAAADAPPIMGGSPYPALPSAPSFGMPLSRFGPMMSGQYPILRSLINRLPWLTCWCTSLGCHRRPPYICRWLIPRLWLFPYSHICASVHRLRIWQVSKCKLCLSRSMCRT